MARSGDNTLFREQREGGDIVVSFDVLIEMPLHQPSVALEERMSLATTGTHMVLFHLELAPHQGVASVLC